MRERLAVFYWGILAAVLIYSAFLRWPFLSAPGLWPDEALYSWYADRLRADPGLLFSQEIIEFHPPLFASLLALGRTVLPQLNYHVIPFAVNLLGIYLMFRLGSKIRDRFTGVFAAVCLAFNYLYFSSGVHILTDGVLLVAVLLFMNILVVGCTSAGRPGIKDQIVLGLAAAGCILLKWSGLLVLPLLVVYSIVRTSLLPVVIALLCTGCLLLNNFFQTGHILPETSALQGKYLIKPVWYYLANLHNILIVPYLLPFLIFGFWVIVSKRTVINVLLAVGFLGVLAGISFAFEKDLRYGLLLLPSALLISGIGVSAAIDRLSKKAEQKALLEILTVAILLVTQGLLLPRTLGFLEKQALTFSGFQEAGGVIKNTSTPQTAILASSPRLVRYYSGFNFQEFGGPVQKLPVDQQAFEQALNNERGPVIVEIDSWERTLQPQWIYPVVEQSKAYMGSLGFSLEHVVGQNIWIFRRPAQ